MRNSKGYTLVEVIIVLTIVIVLSRVVIVAVTAQIKSIKLNNAADKMVSDLLYSKTMANATGVWYGVSIEANPTNLYSVYTTNGTIDSIVIDPSDKTSPYTIPIATDYGIQISSVAITGGGKKIEFRPDGVPFTDKSQSPNNPLTSESVVTLTNGTDTRTVRVTPNTGRTFDQ